MKKKIKIMIYPMVIMVLFMLFTISCKKETMKDPKNLAGTTWMFSDTNDEVNLVTIIKFIGSNNLTNNTFYTGASNLTFSLPGNYTYTPPNIEIVVNNVTYRGVISGASMCLTTATGDVNVYIKH